MKSRLRSLFCSPLTIGVVLCISAVGVSGFERRNETVQKWVDANYWTIVNELLPIKDIKGQYIGYRFTRNFPVDSIEYSFVIEATQDPSHPLLAIVRMADGTPIHTQMLTLRQQNPRAELSEIQEKIKIKRWEFEGPTCPAIRVQFVKFQELRFKTPRFSVVVLDGPDYELIAQTGAGRMTLLPEESDDPAVLWASETRGALAQCGASGSAE